VCCILLGARRLPTRKTPMARLLLFVIPIALAQVATGASAASAISSTRDMYSFWCTGERAQKPMCKHHELAVNIAKTQDATERKKISEQIKQVFMTAKSAATGAVAGSLNPFAKDYAEMKMAYCSTNPASAKILCSTAASRYSTATNAPSALNSMPSNVATSSTTKAMEWYCSKPGQGGMQDSICKRTAILKKMREEASLDERKKLAEQLKQYPTSPYGTMQGIYADFCKLKTSAELPLCLSLRRTTESKQMNKWYCGQPANKLSLWCKRTDLLEKIQKLSTDAAASEERKQLSMQMAAMMKTVPGAAESPSKKLSNEIAAAKSTYCASHPDLAYCKMPSGAASPVG